MEGLSGKLPVSQYKVSSSDSTTQYRAEPSSYKKKFKYAARHRSVSMSTPSVVALTENFSPDPGEFLLAAPLGVAASDRQVRLHVKPEVLAPGSKRLQDGEAMYRNADAFGDLYEEIISLTKEYTPLFERASVSCVGLAYRVDPSEALTCFKKLHGLIREYERRLIESFPSIRARSASDTKLQATFKKLQLEEAFGQEVGLVKEIGGKEALEKSYWHGMRLSEVLISFMHKRMNANFAFSEIMHADPKLMRPDFAPYCYANWIIDNLELLKTYYQYIYASEQLMKNDSAQLQSIYDAAVDSGTFIMKEVCDLLKFTYLNGCSVDFEAMLSSNDKALIQWLDSLKFQGVSDAPFSRVNSRRLLYTIIGYCLVEELDKACLCAERMVDILPIGAIDKGDIFLLVLNLTYLSDILFRQNTDNLSKDILRVSTFDGLIRITQRICDEANTLDKFGGQILPDNVHYDAVRLIRGMGLVLKDIRENLEIEEKKRNDAIIDLIHGEELEKKKEIESRLKYQRKTIRKSGSPIKETGVKAVVDNVSGKGVNEKKEEFLLHPDICAAINLYLAKVPFHDVERRLEPLLAHGSQIDIALAQYALADMLRDKILKTIKLCESYLPTVESFKKIIVQDKLPEKLGLDFLFREAMQVYARESEPVNQDLKHLLLVTSQFNNQCSCEGELLHDIADKMVELHDQLAELTTRGEKVAEDCKELGKLYKLRGMLLRKQGRTGSKDPSRASALNEASNLLKINSGEIEKACSSLRALRFWEVYHRAQQILVNEVDHSQLLGGELDASTPSTNIDSTLESMDHREPLYSVKIASELPVPDFSGPGFTADAASPAVKYGGMEESSEGHNAISQMAMPQLVTDLSKVSGDENEEVMDSGNAVGVFEKEKTDVAISNLQQGEAKVSQGLNEITLNLIPDLIRQQIVKACSSEELKDFTEKMNDLKNIQADFHFWLPGRNTGEHPAILLAEVLMQPVIIRSGNESAVFYPANIAMNIPASVVRNVERQPAFAVQINIDDGACNPQRRDVDKPDLPIVLGHALPDSLVKASCDSFQEKGISGSLKVEEIFSSRKNGTGAGKSKKARQRQRKKQTQLNIKDKALVETGVKPYELESRFNKYVKNYLEKGILRSGKKVPEWFDANRWLNRYYCRQLFSLDDIEAFSSVWSNAFENFDYTDLKCDLMVYAEALSLRIKAEIEHQVVFIFQPGMAVGEVQTDASLNLYDIELVRVKKEWFASHKHYWDNSA